MDAANSKPSESQKNQIFRRSDGDDTKEIRCGCWSSKRYFLMGSLFVGMLCQYSLATNIGMAIIEMTKNRTTVIDNQTIQYEPEFQWDSKTQALLFSMHIYGTFVSIIGGIVVNKIGGVTTFGYALLISGIIAALHPHIARFNFYALLVARFLGGSFSSFLSVSAADVISRWSAKQERSKFTSIVHAGRSVGIAVTFPACGYLAHFWGWPAMFYFTGGLSIVTSLTMVSFFRDDPSNDRNISKRELNYITEERENLSDEKTSICWTRMLTMKPLWALLAVAFGFACGAGFIAVCLPIYVKDMTGKEIHHIGLLSGVPNVAGIFAILIGGYLADYIQKYGIMNATRTHKTYASVGFIFGAVCLFGISFTSNFIIIIFLLTLFEILISLNRLTMVLVPLYMAPKHSSFIMSIVFQAYGLGCIITPMLMGYIVTSHDPRQWNICLSTIGTIMLSATVVFLLFGSSEIQEIVRVKPRLKNEENEEKEEMLL